MVFSSPTFLFFFLPLVVGGYYLMPNKVRNLFLLLASYLFYIWGSVEFVYILLGSTAVDFVLSRFINKKRFSGRVAFVVALILNIGLLAYFKYANFFVEEFGALLGIAEGNFVEVILPLGISFFTFQKISYLVDIYRGEVARLKNFFDYALYIVLFPQLIAGPIVRFHQIRNQLRARTHTFDKFFKGVYRFCIGLSMKVLIADTVGGLHNEISGIVDPSAGMLWLGIFAYAIQIYFDFAGYSSMAIGLGEMFGFEFPQNFNRPYLSRSITEFWKRWHMTLSGFFKEYVYIPLGGNRGGRVMMVRNLLLVFLLTGIWHGADWTFFLWGVYFGVLIVLEKLFLGKILAKWPSWLSQLFTFFLVYLSWVLFQAESIAVAGETLVRMFSFDGLGDVALLSYTLKVKLALILAALISFLPWDSARLRKIERGTYFRVIVIVVLLINCMTSVAGDLFHPFLYFRF
ncbi:MBOAT family protein [Candidatus Peregrinibacteria bacterium]|jgi:alginate O-acetyltransferase complex protein AlgI|nr:MBOAT family protein [Candidatus Peregrinibacteria bacterium]MBT4148071.1 MBOAT family protein [Candidatus Peregrinibacteria bacterium]MBT4366602.1 MBOAT family protein [Candidatus Peregrinibacteria bacterium]MBT4456475.1 MBOAT family protein [Candidatus Peregrinibacteria bacterium]